MDKNSTLSSISSIASDNKPAPVAGCTAVEPREATIRNILEYSRSLEVKRTTSTGNVEVILN